jgi:hypothetical protein
MIAVIAPISCVCATVSINFFVFYLILPSLMCFSGRLLSHIGYFSNQGGLSTFIKS